jgi:hypothetical protein
MSTTLLDRTAQTVLGNRTRMSVGLGVVLVLVAVAAMVLLLTRSGAMPPGPAPPAIVDAHLEQVPGLPSGATDCPRVYPHLLTPYNQGARGTPATSCGFVEQTRMSYAKQPPAPGPVQIRVASPATYKWYDLVCAHTSTYVTCTGAVAAVIYLYNSTA